MQSALLFTMLQSVVAQTEGTNLSGSTLLLLIVAGSAACIAVWAFKQINQFKEAVVATEAKVEEKAEALRQANAGERKLQAAVDEKNDKIQKLKKDVAGLRKKNHSHQEETKQIRDSHKAEMKKLEGSVQAKPAFAKPETKKVQEPASKAPAKEVKVETEQKREPRNESELVKELRDELATAREKRDKAVNRIKAESDSFSKAKADLKELRYRVERYRRVDIMTKNSLELANDKLLTLGRQYYDTVSEIAALKGEVVPPKPKDLRDAEAAAIQRAAAAERAAQEAENEVEEAPVSLSSIDTTNLPEVGTEETEETVEATEAAPTEEATETAEAAPAEEATETAEAAPAEEAPQTTEAATDDVVAPVSEAPSAEAVAVNP